MSSFLIYKNKNNFRIIYDFTKSRITKRGKFNNNINVELLKIRVSNI